MTKSAKHTVTVSFFDANAAHRQQKTPKLQLLPLAEESTILSAISAVMCEDLIRTIVTSY